MKKYFSLIAFLFFAVMAFASPPPDESAKTVSTCFSIDQPAEFPSLYAQVPEVVGHGEVVIYADQIPESDNFLFASLSAQSDSDTGVVEDTSDDSNSLLSIENIISVVLLLLTTVFGAFWRKSLGKFKEAVDLLAAFHTYIEDGNLTKSELADLKNKYYSLIGKT